MSGSGLVTIRTYRQDDIGLVHALSDLLSAQSLYHRFFVGTPRIPTGYLRSLKTVDHRDREVLIALQEDTHAVAIAEYTRDTAAPRTADLAMLVADAWQRRGLARLLLDSLSEIALSCGITHFKADVLADNKAVQTAIHRHRPGSLSVEGSDGLRHFLLRTDPAPHIDEKETEHVEGRNGQGPHPADRRRIHVLA
ncbi:GNAT family N-acetyltransferase [Actinocorallia sp. B10E7]|uniref:GNAT family N-acetyltransferase n=1 Tax=Actinocorallia sp. B10E7 TaxID=3153558 RepID=UPI00325EAA94